MARGISAQKVRVAVVNSYTWPLEAGSSIKNGGTMQRLFRRTVNMTMGAVLGALIVSVIFLAARAWAQETPAAPPAEPAAAAGQVSNASISVVDAPNAPERTIQYQGVLLTPAGAAQPSGTYSMVFRLYQDNTGGPVFQQQTNVVVAEGFFSVNIGPIEPGLFNEQQWLGVTVGNDAEMSPRQPLRYVPYAMFAENARTTSLFRSYGVVNADGSKQNGVKFSSSVINDFDGGPAFVIDILERYNLNEYVTNVTPIYTTADSCDRAVTVSTTSSNDRLIVVMFDRDGNRKLCKFSFSVLDLP